MWQLIAYFLYCAGSGLVMGYMVGVPAVVVLAAFNGLLGYLLFRPKKV